MYKKDLLDVPKSEMKKTLVHRQTLSCHWWPWIVSIFLLFLFLMIFGLVWYGKQQQWPVIGSLQLITTFGELSFHFFFGT